MTTVSGETLLAGRYRVGPLLGRGGMAEVRDGHDERLARPVAVKLLRPDMAARTDVRTRFEAEARAAARLSHPNVVAVFDTGEHDGVPFIVMERLPGETLADRIAAGPVDLAWLRRLAGEVLGALGAAHRAGLVHRDVKPGNILITGDGCAKVADFGIAKSLEEAGAADLTGTNQLVGTPAYLAPERLEGRPATARSDLYALGVVLYEALAAEKPFRGDTPLAVAYAVRDGQPQPLPELRPDLPPDLLDAVARAMETDPDRRFPTADDMAVALGVAGPADAGPAALGPAALDGQAPGAGDPTIGAGPVAPQVAAPGRGDSPTEVLPQGAAAPGEVAAAGLAAARPPGRARGTARAAAWLASLTRRDRRPLLAVAVVLLIALLLAATWGGGGDRAALARRLRAEAASLGGGDGPRSAEAAERLEEVAEAVEAGGGSDAAGALLADVARWQGGGELNDQAAAEVTDVLLDVPGVVPPPPPSTAAPPTTVPPPPSQDDGGEEVEVDEDEHPEPAKKKGKGRGRD